MVRITVMRRHGLQVFRAMLLIEGRVYRESTHMSEQGARNWIAGEINRLSSAAA